MPKLKFSLLCLFLVTPFLVSAHGGVNDEELIIRMTENGFEPKELTVVQGDEVLFINNDDVDRWPASNFHPTHTIYPEFDTEGHVKPGESWKFKFEKQGTWRMHDHLFPHMTGTIVVLEDKTASGTSTPTQNDDDSEARTSFWLKIKNFFKKLFGGQAKVSDASVNDDLLAEFKGLNEKDKYTWLEKRAELEGPETSWKYILAAYNTPQGVIGSPHDMAHLVGQLLFKEYDFEGLSTCTPTFAFGCYHGLMEVAFEGESDSTYKTKLQEARSGCEISGETNSPSYWSCIHGIGHGVATYRKHELEPALTDCDAFDSAIRTYCHDGVFMEFSISAPPSFYKAENPLYPCDIIAESYKTACARAQVQIMKQRFHFDAPKIASTCLASGQATIIHHCIDAIGYFVGQEAQGDGNKVIKSCQVITQPEARAQCLEAAAGELVFQNFAGWQKNTEIICQSLEGKYKQACEKRINDVKTSYGR